MPQKHSEYHQHSPGPWPMHIRHVDGTRMSDEIAGLGWDFDDDLMLPTPMLRGILSKAADAKLVERCHEVPHDCDVAGCPGPENKRKLEAFEDLLAALNWIANTPDGAYSRDPVLYRDNVIASIQERARITIAKATRPQAR